MYTDYIVIALGNPGDDYTYTRHNAGWIVSDQICGEQNFSYQKQLRAWITKHDIGGKQWVFIKPDTYMNESGSIISLIMRQYPDVPADHLIIMHDDVDLVLGDIKLSYDRGSGGHNGIKSLIQHIGNSQFVRYRIGISRTTETGMMVKPDVLGRFHADELVVLEQVGKSIEQICISMSNQGFKKTQSVYKMISHNNVAKK
jgi:PTH1 family peptidyl-tRNA hydrolase